MLRLVSKRHTSSYLQVEKTSIVVFMRFLVVVLGPFELRFAQDATLVVKIGGMLLSLSLHLLCHPSLCMHVAFIYLSNHSNT